MTTPTCVRFENRIFYFILLILNGLDLPGLCAQFLSSLLTQNLFNVITTSSGKAALDTLLKEHVDLVMSDVMMPDMDGLHLVKAIRERPDWRTLPIILLSARADKDAQIGGIQAGADDYIAKPFSTKVCAREKGVAKKLIDA